MTCAVPSCGEYFKAIKKSGIDISLHRFPVSNLREAWIEAIGRNDWTPTKHHRICSRHFKSDCFIKGKRTHLLPNAIPTIFQRPLKETHMNQQSVGDDNKKILSGTESEKATTFPGTLHESDYFDTDEDNKDTIFATQAHLDQQSDVKDEIILSGNETPPDVKPITSPWPLQMTCKECLTIARQYEEVVSKQEEEIKSLSSELGNLKKLLEKSKNDLKRANTVSKKRQRKIWLLRKRNERDSVKIDKLNDVINLLADTN